MIGYKVVSEYNCGVPLPEGKYKSLIMCLGNGNCGVEYELGKTTKPKQGKGGLFVYKKLKYAKAEWSQAPIFKCEYKKGTPPLRYEDLRYEEDEEIDFASEVTLLKEIKCKNF